MKKTTLKKIKKANPCSDGWKKLLKSLGKTKADKKELTLEYIIKSNSLSHACWVADKVMGLEKELRLFAYWNAKQAKKFVDDKKAYNKVINTVNLYAYRELDDEAFGCAEDYAWHYTWRSALHSARDSAGSYTWYSARDSALNSAWLSESYDDYMKKAEKAFINIVCNGNLPAKVKTKNHF